MPDPKDFILAGKYNDLTIEVKTHAKIAGMYGRTESFQFTNCRAKFPRSLNLSLNLKYPKESGSQACTIGQAEFDANFDAACSDQEVLRKLLLSDRASNKDLLTDILRTKNYIEITGYNPALLKVKHKKTDPTLLITDDSVFIEVRTKFGHDSKQIKQLLDVTTCLAKQIYKARQNLRE
jgi:hypothetical protein